MKIFFFLIFFFHCRVYAANIKNPVFCNGVLNTTFCIVNSSIINGGNLTAPSDKIILINHASLICNNTQNCQILIKTNLSIIISNSLILGAFVNISGSTITINNSEISTNGTYGPNYGSSNNPVIQGHSFLGMGAHCLNYNNLSDLTYGRICEKIENINISFIKNLSGSGGTSFNKGIFIKNQIFLSFL